MPPRKYVSRLREEGAKKTRGAIIAAAAKLLRANTASSEVSLERVAKAAGFTRLTLYHQFGSRLGLLEAVFDHIAAEGGLSRIPEAMAMTDAAKAIERVAEIFCEFWAHDAAIGRLNGAAGTDAEFADALVTRNERRRELIAVLVARHAGKRGDRRGRRDATDLIFALTGYATFAALSNGRSPLETARLIQSACRMALEKLCPE